jgi:hypothetical protein
MRVQRASRRAWAAPALTVACGLTFLVAYPVEGDNEVGVFFLLVFVAYSATGALVASRHPANPVGWLFCAIGTGFAATEALNAYAAQPERPAGAQVAAWLSTWLGEPATAAIVPLILLFPDGRFLSARWRGLAWVAVGAAFLWAVALAFAPGPLTVEAVRNPVGIEAAGGVLRPLTDIGAMVFTLLILVAIGGLVARFRSAEARERRQIKWVALAAGFAVAMVLVLIVVIASVNTDEGIWDTITALLVASALASFPVAAGLAILRHGLYDIDVVINRTLVYGALTATLAGAYLGSVLLLELALAPLTQDSGLAIAASTLAAAALFRPARAWIQGVVDRRFYRRRYDAARTLESFGSRLRDQVDLDSLTSELRGVVTDTVQPAHVSLWLRERAR